MKTIFSSLSALLLCASMQAQTPPVTSVKVLFRTLGWQVSVAEGNLHCKAAEKLLPISISEDIRSNPQEYSGPPIMPFYKFVTAPDGTKLAVQVASASLSGMGNMPLILFLKDEKNPDIFQTRVLPEDFNAFPPGSYRFANFTSIAPTITLGPKKVSLAPNGLETIKFTATENSRTLFTTVTYKQGNSSVSIYSNNWAHYPLVRTFAFILKNPDRPDTNYIVKRLSEGTDFLSQLVNKDKTPTP